LPDNLREEIDFAPEVYVSIVTLWEDTQIKLNLGKLALQYKKVMKPLKLN
jgi:PIN domain nuclease of toxin-antitoxin system